MQKRQNGKRGKSSKRNSSSKPLKLSPQQIAVVAALLTNSLIVQSILIDKDQTVEIVLQGTLRRKTRMDDLLEELQDMSVGDILDSIKNQIND